MILRWGNLRAGRGGCSIYDCGVGEEGTFRKICSCRALLICIEGIVVVFARLGVW